MTGPPSPRISPLLRRVSTVIASERVAAAVAFAVAAWTACYVLAGRPSWMATTLEVVAAAVTLVMVFIIQHAQRRTELAIQLKLDELVRSSDADDDFVEIEHDAQQLERRQAEHMPATPPR